MKYACSWAKKDSKVLGELKLLFLDFTDLFDFPFVLFASAINSAVKHCLISVLPDVRLPSLCESVCFQKKSVPLSEDTF